MHNTVVNSEITDALAAFAVKPLTDMGVLLWAGLAVSQAREVAILEEDISGRIPGLLQSQGNDMRVRAWELGALLAHQTQTTISMPVLAAVIALGESLKVPEDEIAAAAAIGIEAAVRILAAVDSAEYRQRWNVASSVGVLGAALAASRLLKLDEARTRHALGLAATQTAGLARNEGHSMASIEVGKAAADAIEASILAKHGFTSAPAAIDGRRGFAALMAYRFEAGAITEGLGERWVMQG
ncbi:MmgE/PrpD family protein [Pseudomonas sp. NA-150]|uniref:MmgE/PrpD family protein n=1 Tax=Pseudomonas sp. NA-150 TaxID=3367525 RepID=UPI0037C9DEC1